MRTLVVALVVATGCGGEALDSEGLQSGGAAGASGQAGMAQGGTTARPVVPAQGGDGEPGRDGGAGSGDPTGAGGSASGPLLAILGSEESYGAVALSEDERFVAFVAPDNSLVPGDSGHVDVFVRDIAEATTERISVGVEGEPANGDSLLGVAISADGRFVAFASAASNLVADDSNGVADVFVRDRELRTTRRVSIASNGDEADEGVFWSDRISISADGQVVSFTGRAQNLVPGPAQHTDVFVHDLETGLTERVPPEGAGGSAGGSAGEATLSADGRFVAFGTTSQLLPADTDDMRDVYLYDRTAGELSLASVSSSGEPLSGWAMFPVWLGQRLMFYAGEPETLYARDLESGEVEQLVDVAYDGYGAASADGGVIAYAPESNEIRMKETVSDESTPVVSKSPLNTFDAFPHQLSLSGQARWIAFCTLESCQLLETEF